MSKRSSSKHLAKKKAFKAEIMARGIGWGISKAIIDRLGMDDIPALVEAADTQSDIGQRKLLLELVNLGENEAEFVRFRRLFPDLLTEDARRDHLIELRDILREFWRADQSVLVKSVRDVAVKGQVAVPGVTDFGQMAQPLFALFHLPSLKAMSEQAVAFERGEALMAPPLQQGWEFNFPLGIMRPKITNLPGQIAWGICRNYQYFAICVNPDCPARFYLRWRKDQIYCTASDCARYKNRITSKRFWRENFGSAKLRQQAEMERKAKGRNLIN